MAAAAQIWKTPKEKPVMEWTRSETIGLSSVKCTKCEGTGLRPGIHRDGNSPCGCVLRTIFRVCLNRLRHCESLDAYQARVTYEYSPGRDTMRSWTHPAQDYAADFYLIAKRTLDEAHFRIFRLHFLLGGDWVFCCRVLKIDRGTFFHSVYRIEQQLGRAYRETRPYALYPPDEYFGGTIRKAKVMSIDVPVDADKRRALTPPVRLAA